LLSSIRKGNGLVIVAEKRLIVTSDPVTRIENCDVEPLIQTGPEINPKD
jgi:hypothetical protein